MHKIKALLVVCSKHLKIFKLVFERLEFCFCHLLSSRFRKMALFQPIPQRKIYKARKSASANIYKPMYRFEERNVEYLAEIFLGNTEERRGGALSPKQRMEIYLRYMGDPGFQVGVGEDSGAHHSTVCRTVDYVSRKILEKANQWIKFPTRHEEVEDAKRLWQEKYNFPCAFGALDCTQIKIRKPAVHGDEYICRKQFASINVQATCNSDELFTSVDASWPGSVHDSRILRNSDILPVISRFDRGQAVLLADSGYAIAPWLMTPYRNPQTPVENYFNEQHATNRIIIERCFGQVKKRFPILMNEIRVSLNKILRIITSCFVLHNVAKYLNDQNNFVDIVEDDDNYQENGENENQVRMRGIQRRNELARILFALR
jgi:hypothetical protein